VGVIWGELFSTLGFCWKLFNGFFGYWLIFPARERQGKFKKPCYYYSYLIVDLGLSS
jgi:hypothetical protein